VTLQNGGGIDLALTNGTIAGALTMTDGFIYSSGAARTFAASSYAMSNGTVASSVGLSGTGTLTKNGAGTVTLSGNNTYSGLTMVTAGTLLLSAGNINSTSGVSVANGATFTNNSTTAFNKGLTLAEGSVVSGSGSFAPTALTLTADLSDGFTTFALGSTSLTKAGNLELTLSGITNGTYTLFSGSVISGAFSGLTIGGIALTNDGSGNFSGLVGANNFNFTNTTNELLISIPEPATWALLAFSLTTVMVLRRHRTRN
jgi:autotransporter-associated beta strand protein